MAPCQYEPDYDTLTKWELLECSFCSVPVDPGAAVTARAQTQESGEMANTETRAGKVLSAANQKRLQDAAAHHERALIHHKALGEQLDALRAMQADDADPEAVADQREEAGDTHRALGRTLRDAHRCLRSAIDSGSPKDEKPDDPDTPDETRSLDLRRREADLLALSQP